MDAKLPSPGKMNERQVSRDLVLPPSGSYVGGYGLPPKGMTTVNFNQE